MTRFVASKSHPREARFRPSQSDGWSRIGKPGLARRTGHIRVLPEFRSEHINRDALLTPAETLYFGTDYDLVDIEIPPSMRRVNLLAAMARIAFTRASVLELPEPLWARFLPRNVFLAATWTLSGLLRGRWRRARTYAMENNEPLTALFGDRRMRPMLMRIAQSALGMLVWAMYERIAFGSEAAAKSYRSLPCVGRLESMNYLQLPGRPPRGITVPDCATPTAAFVGELAPRKGVVHLLRAWELLEARCPIAQLHIVGSGPLEAEVSGWASERPNSRRYRGHVS
jgi:hypothetical protein